MYYDESFRNQNLHLSTFKVYALKHPNMIVYVNPGSFWSDNEFIEFSGEKSPVINTPYNNARWVIISIRDHYSKGIIHIIEGEISDNPILPGVSKGELPLCSILIEVTTVKITNNMIHDIRPVFTSQQITSKIAVKNETIKLTETDINNKYISLSYVPVNNPTFTIFGGSDQRISVDYRVSANRVIWDGMDLDGILSLGDVVMISYTYQK